MFLDHSKPCLTGVCHRCTFSSHPRCPDTSKAKLWEFHDEEPERTAYNSRSKAAQSGLYPLFFELHLKPVHKACRIGLNSQLFIFIFLYGLGTKGAGRGVERETETKPDWDAVKQLCTHTAATTANLALPFSPLFQFHTLFGLFPFFSSPTSPSKINMFCCFRSSSCPWINGFEDSSLRHLVRWGFKMKSRSAAQTWGLGTWAEGGLF